MSNENISQTLKVAGLVIALEHSRYKAKELWDFAKKATKEKLESEGVDDELEIMLRAYSAFAMSIADVTLQRLEKDNLILVPDERSEAVGALAASMLGILSSQNAIVDVLQCAKTHLGRDFDME